MRHLLRCLSLACLLGCIAGCVGRRPQGEFRLDTTVPPSGPELSMALYQSVGVPLEPGNRIELIFNGHVFDAIIDEIGRAQKSIHIETFIWANGKVSDRMIEAISERGRRGVSCRILVDSVGSVTFGDQQQRLEKAGCEVRKFRPVPGQDDLARNHRKITVIDGKVGFTGGFGIDDKWLGRGHSDDPPEWHDANARVIGPAVREMQQAFAENWQEAGGTLLPLDSFPEPDRTGSAAAGFVSSTEQSVVTRGDRAIQLLIASARKRLWIANAYFVPSTPIMELLTRKAKEGVDVRIMAAGDKTDTKVYLPMQRARMDQLTRDGVRTFEYDPAMMHDKTMLVDDRLVLIGSSNLDALSLNKMEEGFLVIEDPGVAADLEKHWMVNFVSANERKLEKPAQAQR